MKNGTTPRKIQDSKIRGDRKNIVRKIVSCKVRVYFRRINFQTIFLKESPCMLYKKSAFLNFVHSEISKIGQNSFSWNLRLEISNKNALSTVSSMCSFKNSEHSNSFFRFFLTKFIYISRFQLLRTSIVFSNVLRYFQTNFVIFKRTSLIFKEVRF
jgi:hypothetical protein